MEAQSTVDSGGSARNPPNFWRKSTAWGQGRAVPTGRNGDRGRQIPLDNAVMLRHSGVPFRIGTSAMTTPSMAVGRKNADCDDSSFRKQPHGGREGAGARNFLRGQTDDPASMEGLGPAVMHPVAWRADATVNVLPFPHRYHFHRGAGVISTGRESDATMFPRKDLRHIGYAQLGRCPLYGIASIGRPKTKNKKRPARAITKIIGSAGKLRAGPSGIPRAQFRMGTNRNKSSRGFCIAKK